MDERVAKHNIVCTGSSGCTNFHQANLNFAVAQYAVRLLMSQAIWLTALDMLSLPSATMCSLQSYK